MALGFLLDDGITRVLPDRGFSKKTTPRVLKARFGDGYEQRMPDGINSLDQTFNVAFINRTVQEIDSILEFFDAKLGAILFEFTILDSKSEIGETTIKVVCEDYDIIYTNHIVSGCTAVFRRVYE